MKRTIKLTNLAMIALLLMVFSCGKDDEMNEINVQDLLVAIDENPVNGQVIGTVATTQTVGGGTLVFSITSQTPSGALNIGASTGELKVADADLFDFETNQIITATISVDGAVNTGSATIKLNNISELTTQDLDVAIDENPTNGQSIGTVQAGGDGALSFSITSQTPTGALNIDASTGELTVADATLFDFETNPVITANISVDNSGNMATAIATINLNDINELSIQDFDATIDENPTNGQSIGTVQAGGDGSFSITSQTPSGALNIDASTGELTVADATLFDFETNPVITATISVDNSASTESATATIDLSDAHEVGEFKFGGVIFWVNSAGDEGYTVSIEGQSAGTEWGCYGINIPGAYGSAFGDGEANTLAIVSMCPVPGTAADIANDVYNGYTDWFLPSYDELNEVYLNRAIIDATSTANGGTNFGYNWYWTSTQQNGNSNNAYIQSFGTGLQALNAKANMAKVRAVRTWTDF